MSQTVGAPSGAQRPATPVIPEVASAPPVTPSASTNPAQEMPPPLFVYADVSGEYSPAAGISSTSGNLSTTQGALAVGGMVRINPKLSVGGGIDTSETFYRFSGASGLVPDGVRPWGTIRSVGIGIRASYRVDDHWTVNAGMDGASSGEQGAKFGSSLTGGGAAGFTYKFDADLTLGLQLVGQSRLESNPFIIPFPVVDWVLPFDPQRRFRFEVGSAREGPSHAGGVTLVFSPSKELSFSAGVAGVGAGGEFRLDRHGPVPDGVGRDDSFPLTIGVNYQPNKRIDIGAFAGISTNRKIDLLNAGGGRVNRQDVDTAPIFGIDGSIRF